MTADLLIAMREGIKSKKQVRPFYDTYEKDFKSLKPSDEDRFDKVITTVDGLFPDNGLSTTEFTRPVLFYSLFTTIYHCLYGIPDLKAPRTDLSKPKYEAARNALNRVDELLPIREADEAKVALSASERQFLQDCRRATTDETPRERRTRFLATLIAQ